MPVMYFITAKTIIWICWIAINLSFVTSLKDVHVTVPSAVKRGDNASLICSYDLEEDTLYSIKWYKGKREFYRYTPRENPPMKVFSVSGIIVERSMSNASNVMLTSVEPTVSGKYSCEVSADAPSFHTVIVSGDLEVVELPSSGPVIDIIDKIYRIADILTANCSLNNTKPIANLTWIINNYPAMPHQLVFYKNLNEAAIIGLKLVLTPKHFRSKYLRIACRANIYGIYDEYIEKLIELDSSSNNLISLENSRHSLYDGEIVDQYDIQMHHIQDISSSASTLSVCLSSSKICWFIKNLLNLLLHYKKYHQHQSQKQHYIYHKQQQQQCSILFSSMSFYNTTSTHHINFYHHNLIQVVMISLMIVSTTIMTSSKIILSRRLNQQYKYNYHQK